MKTIKFLVGLVLVSSLLSLNAAPAGASTTTTIPDVAGDAWGAGVVPLADRSDERIDALGAAMSYDSATQTITTVIDVADIEGDRGLGPVGFDQTSDDETIMWFVTFSHAGDEYAFYGYLYPGSSVGGTCFEFVALEAFPAYQELGFDCHYSGVDIANDRVTISFTLGQMNSAMGGWNAENQLFAPGDTLNDIQIVTTRDSYIADRSLPTDTRSLKLV